ATDVVSSANRIGFPTTSGSPPYISCQMRYEMTTGGGAFLGGGWFVTPPSVMGNPNTVKKPSLTKYAVVLSGVPSLRSSVTSFDARPAARTIGSEGSFRRRTSTGDRFPDVTRPSVSVVRSEYRSSGLGYGSGFRSAALMVLKMAVVAPMPMASVQM